MTQNERNTQTDLENQLKKSLEAFDREGVRYACYWLYKYYRGLANYSIDSHYFYASKTFEFFYFSVSLKVIDLQTINKARRLRAEAHEIAVALDSFDLSLELNAASEEFIDDYATWQNASKRLNSQDYDAYCREIARLQGLPVAVCLSFLYWSSVFAYLKASLCFCLATRFRTSGVEYRNAMQVAAERSRRLNPHNYLALDLLKKAKLWLQDGDDWLPYNHSEVLLRGQWAWASNAGVRSNEEQDFETALLTYRQGLSASLYGDRYILYRNISIAHYDRAKGGGSNPTGDLQASITFSYESLLDFMTSVYHHIHDDITFGNSDSLKHWVECINHVAISHRRLGRTPRAIELLEGSLRPTLNRTESDPRSRHSVADACNNLGLFLTWEREYNRAKPYLYKALELGPQDPSGAMLSLARCYYQLSEFQSMLSVSERAIRQSSGQAKQDAMYNQMLAALNLGERNVVRELEPNLIQDESEDLSSVLGAGYLHLGEQESAKRMADLAISRNNPEGHLLWSDYYRKYADDDQAIESLVQYFRKSISEMIRNTANFDRDAFESTTFYKFRPLHCYTYDGLSNNYIFLQDFSRLNDPFDCRLIAEYQNDQVFREALRRVGMPKVMSLCTNNDHRLLWSHYAENHSGICIGYRFNLESMYALNLIGNKVKYVSNPTSTTSSLFRKFQSPIQLEDASFVIPPRNHLLNVMIEKETAWEYEQEFRLISFEENKLHGSSVFRVSEVIFGCKSEDEYIRAAIRTLIQGYGTMKEVDVEKNEIAFDDTTILFGRMRVSPDDYFRLEKDPSFSLTDYLDNS